MKEKAECRVYRFGIFEADASAAELRKQGVRVKLHAQPFQVLMMLLERPSEVITRDELRQRLWDAGTFVDFDHGLNSAINKIRTALGDSSAQPRYLETLAGKGYRFIAPVSQVPADGSPAATPILPASPARAVLSTPAELPAASPKVAGVLLVLVQALYLGIYLTALGSLPEVWDLLRESDMPPRLSMTVLIVSAAALIPVRLYLIAAACLRLTQLPVKFARMFPALLILDLLWALSPFLLVHHVAVGLALAMSATLVYLPFAQRSLVLMYGRV